MYCCGRLHDIVCVRDTGFVSGRVLLSDIIDGDRVWSRHVQRGYRSNSKQYMHKLFGGHIQYSHSSDIQCDV